MKAPSRIRWGEFKGLHKGDLWGNVIVAGEVAGSLASAPYGLWWSIGRLVGEALRAKGQ